jgi:uncharacterized repeat protein (TIGR03803 family)
VLYTFPAIDAGPEFGDVIFDAAGNMYGTTALGGADGAGAVWELTPPGTWNTETLLNSFTVGNGEYAYGGVIFDSSGNLYGTTFLGGANRDGVVYQLVESAGSWTENVLHNFTGGNDGSLPVGGLVFDASGNLYGAATNAGAGGGGTIFELSPPGTWTTFTPIYSFSFSGSEECVFGIAGPGPWAQLTMDSAGNLYGTTCADGTHHYGSVFELKPSNGGWTYKPLRDGLRRRNRWVRCRVEDIGRWLSSDWWPTASPITLTLASPSFGFARDRLFSPAVGERVGTNAGSQRLLSREA